MLSKAACVFCGEQGQWILSLGVRDHSCHDCGHVTRLDDMDVCSVACLLLHAQDVCLSPEDKIIIVVVLDTECMSPQCNTRWGLEIRISHVEA